MLIGVRRWEAVWIWGQQQIIYCLKEAVTDLNALACRLLPAAEPHECAYWDGTCLGLDLIHIIWYPEHCLIVFNIIPPWCPSTQPAWFYLDRMGFKVSASNISMDVNLILYGVLDHLQTSLSGLLFETTASTEATTNENWNMWLPLYGQFGSS